MRPISLFFSAMVVLLPAPAFAQIAQNQTVVNLGMVGAIDPNFGIAVRWGGVKLRGLSVNINVIRLTTLIAKNDWLASLPTYTYTAPDYQDVSVTFIPTGSRQLQNRYAVWGLYNALYQMTLPNKFETGTWILFWKRAEIGTITFSKIGAALEATATVPVGAVAKRSAQPLPASSINSIPSNATTTFNEFVDDDLGAVPVFENNANANTEYKMRIDGGSGGAILTPAEVFMTTMDALLHVAEQPALATVQPFTSFTSDFDAKLEMQDYQERPRRRPPYFQYIYAINTLEKIPLLMVRDRKFANTDFQIYLSDRQSGQEWGVGQGTLTKGRPRVQRIQTF